MLASIFGVIPFAQDKGAQQDLGAITTAQGVYKAQITEGVSYAKTLDEVKAANLVGQDVKNIYVAGDQDSWAAISKSNSGKFFEVTSKNTTPVPVTLTGTTDAELATSAQAKVEADK